MGEDNSADEQRGLTEEELEHIDILVPSPAVRAKRVWHVINARTEESLTDWDLICFAIEILGLYTPNFPWMQQAVMKVSQLVYKAHYLNFDRLREVEQVIIERVSKKDKSKKILILPRIKK